jgi:hypothetical protein
MTLQGKSMRFTPGIITIAAAVALTACQQKPDEKLIGTCWSPDAKQTVQGIAARIISSHIADALIQDDHGKKSRAQVEQFVNNRLTVTLSNFYLTSADPNTGVVSCGADAAMTFKRSDGQMVTGDNASFAFSSYPAEGNSSMYVIPVGLPLTQLVDTAAENAPPLADPQPAAPASDAAPSNDTAQAASDAAAAAAVAASSQ